MSKRKGLSRTLRFEVLKRDKFTCQYCGAKAPEVLLQVDHIIPVAKGGLDEVMNLIASCQPCNGGKGATQLSDDSVIVKRRAQVDGVADLREQITMMSEWQNSLVDLEAESLGHALDYYERLIPGWTLSEDGAGNIRLAIRKHGLEAVMSTIRSVTAKHVRIIDGKASAESSAITTRVLLDELKYRGYREKNPIESELRYIRGILRNRLSYCDDDRALDIMRLAHRAGVSVASLKAEALRARTFSDWDNALYLMVQDLGSEGE